MQTQEALNILGLKEGASEKEINTAFRKLAKEAHPDSGGSEDKFKKVNEAYQFLKKEGTTPRAAPFNFDPFDSWHDDFFSEFMRGVREQARKRQYTYNVYSNPGFGDPFDFSRRNAYPQKVPDLHVRLEITVDEAVLGAKKVIEFQIREICRPCEGLGYISGPEDKVCPKCDGKKHREYPGVEGKKPCVTCKGSGVVGKNGKCTNCNGFCTISNKKKVNVTIPPATFSGKQLRLHKQGDNIKNNAGVNFIQGDVIVHIYVKEDSHLKIENRNIISSINLSLFEALNGATKDIWTFKGVKKVKFPAKLKHGAQVRLPKMGVPSLNTDHLINVSVDYPEGEELEKVLEVLSQEEIDNNENE